MCPYILRKKVENEKWIYTRCIDLRFPTFLIFRSAHCHIIHFRYFQFHFVHVSPLVSAVSYGLKNALHDDTETLIPPSRRDETETLKKMSWNCLETFETETKSLLRPRQSRDVNVKRGDETRPRFRDQDNIPDVSVRPVPVLPVLVPFRPFLCLETPCLHLAKRGKRNILCVADINKWKKELSLGFPANILLFEFDSKIFRYGYICCWVLVTGGCMCSTFFLDA